MRRPSILDERLLSFESQARLGQHGLGRNEIGLRGAQRVLLVLGIETGDHLTCGNHIADIDRPLDHAAVEAKGEADLILGADLARHRNGLAFRAVLDRDRPDGPGLGSGRYTLIAGRKTDTGDSGDQNGHSDPRLEHWRDPSSGVMS